MKKLYIAINELMCEIGASGQIDTGSIYVGKVMDALHEFDGGNFDILKVDELFSQWVSAADKPPEGLCLVMCDGEIHTADYRHKNLIVIGGHFDFDREPVTHWMPRPTVPEG